MLSYCQHHWDSLRAAVESRGMTHLVARNGEQAADDAVAQIKGEDTLENWDPLMASYWNISNKILKKVGVGVLFGEQPFCPLCAVRESYEGVLETPLFDPDRHKSDDWWINSCMDAMLEYAREMNLMPGVQ